MKIAVLGAGLQGRAVCHYLSQDDRVSCFVCHDASLENLSQCQKFLGHKGMANWLDAADFKKLLEELQNYDGVINTLPYALLEETTHYLYARGFCSEECNRKYIKG